MLSTMKPLKVSGAKNKKGSVMKIRALLAALCCVVGLVFVTGCESPEKGFKEWKKAIVKGDAAAAKARTAKDSQQYVELMIAGIKDDAETKKNFENAKVVSCTKNGDKATLKVKSGDKDGEFKMVKEDGKWKVSFK